MRTPLGRRAAVALTVIGGVLTPLAGYGLSVGDAAKEPATESRPPAAREAHAAGGVVEGLAVTVRRAVYQPGQSSGWHSHAGIHTVIVLSGTLTVYDTSCRPHSFGVDQPYVGGMDDHLARNESDAPVEMTVVYARAPGTAAADEVPAKAPAEGCPV